MQMEAVQSARVLIAKPDPSPFVREQKQPTASVVIKLKPRASMSPATAAGIVSLVARSVEGLRPENVTVLETGGRLLSDPHAGDRGNLPTPQLEYLERLETYLSTKAEEMLAKTLGPGRAVIRVSAEVNFQKIKERLKTYSPDGKVAWAERTANSTSSGGTSRGPAGAVSNVARARRHAIRVERRERHREGGGNPNGLPRLGNHPRHRGRVRRRDAVERRRTRRSEAAERGAVGN